MKKHMKKAAATLATCLVLSLLFSNGLFRLPSLSDLWEYGISTLGDDDFPELDMGPLG